MSQEYIAYYPTNLTFIANELTVGVERDEDACCMNVVGVDVGLDMVSGELDSKLSSSGVSIAKMEKWLCCATPWIGGAFVTCMNLDAVSTVPAFELVPHARGVSKSCGLDAKAGGDMLAGAWCVIAEGWGRKSS